MNFNFFYSKDGFLVDREFFIVWIFAIFVVYIQCD